MWSSLRPVRLRAILALALGLAAVAAPARAADPVGRPVPAAAAPDDASDLWIVSLGATTRFGPRYEGSKRFDFVTLPDVSFRRADEPRGFSSPDDGFDVTLYSTPRFVIGPVANFRSSTRGKDSRLAGFNDRKLTLELGPFVEYWPVEDRLRIRAELRQALRAKDGRVLDLSMDAVQHIGDFTLSGGPRLSLADGRAMTQMFGISPLQALRNGRLPAFKAEGGIKSFGYGIALAYQFNERWQGTIFHRYDRLVGDAADSPVTSLYGTRNEFTFGLGLSRDFTFGSGPRADIPNPF